MKKKITFLSQTFILSFIIGLFMMPSIALKPVAASEVKSIDHTKTTVDEVKSIASGGPFTLGSIRVDELFKGSLENATDAKWSKITLTLPSDYHWHNDEGKDTSTQKAATISLVGGFAGHAQIAKSDSGEGASPLNQTDRKLFEYIESDNSRNITFYFKSDAKNEMGSIILNNAQISADGSAPLGGVYLSVDGDRITNQSLLIARRTFWGARVTIDEVKTFVTGKVENIRTGEIEIRESFAHSWIDGREMEVSLPEDTIKVFAEPGKIICFE